MRFFLCLVLLSEMVEASEIVRCNPNDLLVANRVIEYDRSANTQETWLTDPAYIVNPPNLPGGSQRYWKCQAGQVVEMTPSEKTTLDAPLVAEQARQQAFTDEISGITGDDLCNAELAVIDTKLDTGINTITDLATAKTFLRVALKKITRCLRARAR